MTELKNNHDLSMKQMNTNADKELIAIKNEGQKLKNEFDIEMEKMRLEHEFRMAQYKNQNNTPNSFQNQSPYPCPPPTNFHYYQVYQNQYPNPNPQFEKPVPQNNGYNCPNYQSQPPMSCSFPPPQQGYYQQTPQYQYNNFRQIPQPMMNMNYMQTPPGSY